MVGKQTFGAVSVVVARVSVLMLHYILQYTQTLTLVTHWYNQLHSTILAVELGLVKDEIDRMKGQLEPALQDLTWDQDDLWSYIESTQDMVKVLNVSCISKGNPFNAFTNKGCMLT